MLKPQQKRKGVTCSKASLELFNSWNADIMDLHRIASLATEARRNFNGYLERGQKILHINS